MKIVALVCPLLLRALLAPSSGDAAQESLKKGKEALEKYNAKEAITHLTEAIRKDPKNAEAYYYRGLAYDREQQDERAFSDFNAAIRLNPKFAEAFVARGRYYFTKA